MTKYVMLAGNKEVVRMPKQRAERRGKVRITIEMEPDVVEIIEEFAEAQERNLSQQIRLICRQWCNYIQQKK